MLTDLAVPFLDARASRLAWSLGLDRQPALEHLALEHLCLEHLCLEHPALELRGAAVEMRLLGASHQVVVDSARGSWSEVVACSSGATTASLPSVIRRERGGEQYRFRSMVARLGAAALAERVDNLVVALAGRPDALVGRFPGSPHAVTAVVARPSSGGVRWRTVHAYPQTGELVATTSSVRW